MATIFRIKIVKNFYDVVPVGLELNVTTQGFKPNLTDVKKAIIAAGYPIDKKGGNFTEIYYEILG